MNTTAKVQQHKANDKIHVANPKKVFQHTHNLMFNNIQIPDSI